MTRWALAGLAAIVAAFFAGAFLAVNWPPQEV